MKAVEVLLPKPFDTPFTYLAPVSAKVGMFVKAPFRNQNLIGVIWNDSPKDSAMKLKEVAVLYDSYTMPDSMRKFIEWVAKYNLAEVGKILKMSLSAAGVLDKPLRYALESEIIDDKLATLSPDQAKAYEDIKHQEDFQVHVIDGVTGSGKTEVYLHLIKDIINNGQQVLVLLPEIVLTSQLTQRFEERLGIKPLEWHSELGVKKRKQNWLAALDGSGKFFVGARSALFLPYKNLRIIVVDEEHDASFKQEEGVVYNARDMAVIRAKEEGIPLLLCSATPSIETIYNVKSGKYIEHKLPSRYGTSVLPEVRIIDMIKQDCPKGQWISQALRDEIQTTFKNNKQSLLFLNRRGYAPTTYCGNCHEKVSCPNCNFAMVEHRNKNVMQCHYCGHKTVTITKCPTCGSDERIYHLGPGVERIAEEVQEFMPEARISILSSDQTPSRDEISEVINDITDHKVDIIIGTQMITKGLHFPQLHLVGVIDAEGGIFGCDIRAVERTYQLLHQVAGRAGRMKDKGLVLLQTNEPESELLKNLVDNNIEGFIAAELKDREVANMPPFSKLAIITVSSKFEVNNMRYLHDLIRLSPESDDVKILGPSPCPMFVLRGQYRHRVIVQTSKQFNIQQYIKVWLAKLPNPKFVKVKVDIDPINFS